MCMFKSGIILKDSVYLGETMCSRLGKSESHTEMLKALKIKDTTENEATLFVRAELSPIDGAVFSDIDTWKFNVDQDIVPKWFVQEYEETRMRYSVKEWAKTHIFVGVDGLELTEGNGYYLKDCTNVKISGTANVQYVCGNSTVLSISGKATVNFISDNAEVDLISGNVKIYSIYGNVKIDFISDCVKIRSISDNVKIGNIFDNVKINRIFGSVEIDYISGYVKIDSISGYVKIGGISGNVEIDRISGNAIIISSRDIDWKNKKLMKINGFAKFEDKFTNKTKFCVDVREVLITSVQIQANSIQEAKEIVKKMYENSEIVLDYECFTGDVDIRVCDKDFKLLEDWDDNYIK